MIKIEKIDKYFNRFRKNKLHVILLEERKIM